MVDRFSPGSEDIVAMARAAQTDDRLADGALYGKLADEIERLREAVNREIDRADLYANSRPAAQCSAGTEDADTRETIATMLWHRFAPNHHIEWKYEALRAEYLDAADQVIAALRSPGAAQAESKPVGFMQAMDIVEAGFNNWKGRAHNQKWFRRIDGTPIPNDLMVNIAEAISRASLVSSTHEAAKQALAYQAQELDMGYSVATPDRNSP